MRLQNVFSTLVDVRMAGRGRWLAANESHRQAKRILGPPRLGAATVELAVILPLLVLLFVIGVDYARVFYFSQVLSNCARNGALYSADDEAAKDSPYANVTEAAKADAPAFMRDDLTVSESSKTVDGRDYVVVTVSYDFGLLTDFPGLTGTQTISKTVEMAVIPAAPDPYLNAS